MRRARGEHGSSSLQTVLVMPLLLLLITLIVQFALWYHASHIAIAAAQDGARAARVEGGTELDGRGRAQQILDQLGTNVLVDSSVTVTRDARMKAWPGGVRVFNVEVVGTTAPPKRIEFRGEPVSVPL